MYDRLNTTNTDNFAFIAVLVFKLLRRKVRSNRLEVFCKKRVLRNFVKFIGKHLCQSLF